MSRRAIGRKLVTAPAELTADPESIIEARAASYVDLASLMYKKPRMIVTVHSDRVGTFEMRCDPDIDDDELDLLVMAEVDRRVARWATD